MEIMLRPLDLSDRVRAWRVRDERTAFVPTMGNLHAGHGDLVSRARQLADHVVVSVFVNPTQFGPNEDFAQYPRTPDEDCRLLEKIGVDVLFRPEVEDIYPAGYAHSTIVDVPELTHTLCGEFRPGHFQGVATVVVKLLNLVAPDVALFGEKDFQQLAVIRRAVTDLCLPVTVVGAPTVREPDGLAMSSRNRYLTPEQRALAPRIYAALAQAQSALQQGEHDYDKLENIGRAALTAAGFNVDYFSVRDAATLRAPQPHKEYQTQELVILTAARLGRTRLIDNVRVSAVRN
jgi:pantoate--beta-alanine ligase